MFLNSSFAQEPSVEVNKVTVQGAITEISPEGDYLVVGEGSGAVKFTITKEFLEEAYLEVGDTIKAYGEKVSGLVKLVDYEYILEGGDEPMSLEDYQSSDDSGDQDSPIDSY